MTALVRRDQDEPQPEPRRKSGDTDKGFAKAAAALCGIPVEAYQAASAWLSDTVDWLRLWDDNAEAENLNDFDNDCENLDTKLPTLNL